MQAHPHSEGLIGDFGPDKAQLLSVKYTSVMFWLSPTRPGIICLHNQLFSLIAVFTTGHLWSASVCVKITHHTTVKHKPDQNWARTEILQSTVMVLLVSEAPRCVSCRVTIKLETSYSSPPICHTWPDHNDYNYANVHINKTNRGTGQKGTGEMKEVFTRSEIFRSQLLRHLPLLFLNIWIVGRKVEIENSSLLHWFVGGGNSAEYLLFSTNGQFSFKIR